ncbi:DUF3305 domain-containing protein [Halomonas saccharevitans]|uniref:DUF3305 domain-containing protein n=1 Tax=Halomonas saccharevitans TaxID=416872 RepID=A0A1I6ZZ32_9GAMM|nr:DUF3305 domain-containing protein [Halomonas saccharevitans]SFT67934.1 Protein of unknown function [Halomonas saccharevitans]
MASTSSTRSLSFEVVGEPLTIKGFTTTRWRIADLAPGDTGSCRLSLQLYMTERAAYRFNLTSRTPRLFVRAGEAGGTPSPDAITASQDVAAGWLDGEHRVLEVDMPLAIQAWIEAYLAHHGEAPEEGRKKKRKGAGRAREIES